MQIPCFSKKKLFNFDCVKTSCFFFNSKLRIELTPRLTHSAMYLKFWDVDVEVFPIEPIFRRNENTIFR